MFRSAYTNNGNNKGKFARRFATTLSVVAALTIVGTWSAGAAPLAQGEAPEATCPSGLCFSDVPANDTFAQFINRIYQQDLVTGYACGGPGEPCDAENRPYYRSGAAVTRGQMSKYVDNARHLPGIYINTTTHDSPFVARTTAGGANGVAVKGSSDAGDGIYGASLTGRGVNGYSNNGTGMYGSSLTGAGVRGLSFESIGVLGQSDHNVAVKGESNSNTGVLGASTSQRGVWGESTSGTGVYGHSSSSYGVHGASTSGEGVYGYSLSDSGVYGESVNDYGVTGISGSTFGVYGFSSAQNGGGVTGIATANNGVGLYGEGPYAVFAQATGAGGTAGNFQGDVTVNGDMTVIGSCCAASANYSEIDNPLDPANKVLRHASVESPDMKTVYDGVVTTDANGGASVTLPDYFHALNQDFRYQLTAVGAPGPNLYVAKEIVGNSFKIAGATPGSKVSWQVTGIRKDPYAQQNRVVPVEDKPAGERGFYKNPEVHGQPESKGTGTLDLPTSPARK